MNKSKIRCFQSTSPRFKPKTLTNLYTKIGLDIIMEKQSQSKLKKISYQKVIL